MVHAQLLLLLAAASTASASLSEGVRGSEAARALLADDHHDDGHDGHGDEKPFIQNLGAEDPLDHLLELYTESMSTVDAVSWLLEATRCAAPVEEDPHAGHNHRRLLDAHDHDEHDHGEHDHGEEEAADEHDDHGHDDSSHGASTVLDSAFLVEATRSANLVGNAAKLEMAMTYIIACQADSNCAVEAEHSEEEHSEAKEKNWGLKIGLGLTFMVITIIGTFVPILFKRFDSYAGILSLFNVAAGSIFMTVGIVHLLPEVVEFEAMSDLNTDFPVGFAFVIVGFVLILYVQHVLFAGEDASCGQPFLTSKDQFEERVVYNSVGEVWNDIIGKYRAPMIMQIAILVHVVLESMAVGLAGSRRDAVLLFSAIAAHKIFDSMAVATRLFKRGCPVWLASVLLLPLYTIPFLAVVVGIAMTDENATTSLVLNGLTVGCFVYVGGFEILSEEFTHDTHVRQELEKVREDLAETKVNPDDVPALATPCEGRCSDEEQAAPCCRPWTPSKGLKFLAFVFGVGLIFIFAAFLPKHIH